VSLQVPELLAGKNTCDVQTHLETNTALNKATVPNTHNNQSKGPLVSLQVPELLAGKNGCDVQTHLETNTALNKATVPNTHNNQSKGPLVSLQVPELSAGKNGCDLQTHLETKTALKKAMVLISETQDLQNFVDQMNLKVQDIEPKVDVNGKRDLGDAAKELLAKKKRRK
jgi:hypothetical protein